MFSVIVSRSCFPKRIEWIVKRPFNEHFSRSARTAIRHGLKRVSKMMAMRGRGRLIRFFYPESRNG